MVFHLLSCAVRPSGYTFRKITLILVSIPAKTVQSFWYFICHLCCPFSDIPFSSVWARSATGEGQPWPKLASLIDICVWSSILQAQPVLSIHLIRSAATHGELSLQPEGCATI